MTTRRRFLAATAAAGLIAFSPATPAFLLRAAEAARNEQRVLVVLQLTGGNDGVNTVIPFADPLYWANRFTLAIDRGQVRKIDDQCGFHPALEGFSRLLESGRLAIVNGVGYPQPNRSHFESMDIWHTARRDNGPRPQGWLGRYLDGAARPDGRDLPALHLGGDKQPLALAALHTPVPSVQSFERFRLNRAAGANLRAAIDRGVAAARPGASDLLGFIQQSTAAALATSRRVEEAFGRYQSSVAYPDSELAGQLKSIAQLIDAGLSTRIYYVARDGFDTHSTQAAAHAGLLTQVGGAVAAFFDDLAAHGHQDRVLLVAFSEFGRRLKENASAGTDHGAAAPLFVAGGKVRPGLHGKYPSLADLDDGDLKFHTDFRQVYATLLEDWLGTPSEAILGGKFGKLPLFS